MVTCTAARACWVANASLPLELVAIDLVQQRLFWWVETRYLFWCVFVMFMCIKKQSPYVSGTATVFIRSGAGSSTSLRSSCAPDTQRSQTVTLHRQLQSCTHAAGHWHPATASGRRAEPGRVGTATTTLPQPNRPAGGRGRPQQDAALRPAALRGRRCHRFPVCRPHG